MVWIHAINESAAADFAEDVLNPMHPDKFRTLGKRLRLQPGQRVLDVGAGRCGPARILARDFGVHVTAVEPYTQFLDAARERVATAGLSDQFEFVQSTGAGFEIEPERYDVAMCIGASWAWDGLVGTLGALAPGVRAGGHVVIGEGFTVPGQTSKHFAGQTLEHVLTAFGEARLPVVTLIRSSRDDFDQYYSVQATSLLDWLDENARDADQVRTWHGEAVEEMWSEPFGWGLIAGRKPS